jgi:hypothetical protein
MSEHRRPCQAEAPPPLFGYPLSDPHIHDPHRHACIHDAADDNGVEHECECGMTWQVRTRAPRPAEVQRVGNELRERIAEIRAEWEAKRVADAEEAKP